jgi:hypothetical protein
VNRAGLRRREDPLGVALEVAKLGHEFNVLRDYERMVSG